MSDSYVKRALQAVKVSSIPGITPWRVGNSAGDGGYIVAKELMLPCALHKANMFSFGVGNETSFELFMAPFFRHVWMFDICSCELEKKTPNMYFSQSPFSEDVFKKFPAPASSMLKIDVEGAEWDVLERIIEDGFLDSFSQIVGEFHFFSVNYSDTGHSPYFAEVHRDFYRQVNEKLFHQYYRVLCALHREFFCYHIHANNSLPYSRVNGFQFPPLVELSFVRKSEVCSKGVTDSLKYYPIMDMDVPNKSDRPDFRDVYPLYKEEAIC